MGVRYAVGPLSHSLIDGILQGHGTGSHGPFPMIVRDFQSVISQEAKEQILKAEGKLPAAVVACVGGAPVYNGCPLRGWTTLS